MTYCQCSKLLTNDDIGFHRKMVNRGAHECMCIECLCEHFGLSVEKAHEMIDRFRQSGCTLPIEEDPPPQNNRQRIFFAAVISGRA